MPESVYIESSVISYLVARPSHDVVITARQAVKQSPTSGKAGGLKFVNRSKRLFMAPPKGGNAQSKFN
jgi:hypothetical protein